MDLIIKLPYHIRAYTGRVYMTHKKPTLFQHCLIICLFSIILFPDLVFSQVCKVAYKGRPEDFQDSIMHVPGPTVAVSDTFYVGTPININTDTITTPTIFFIPDHSGSMTTSGNGWVATDPRGYRFTVTSDLMDSLQGEFPRAEIGLSVFNECLYYYYPDDPDYFTILPNQWTPIANKQGAYIP
jgi:hypothetical protein